ncbi:MAG: mRNA interferase MazF [Candidatus Paceibacteria bacterium]|jgi:mRNA interferase MazF
MYRKWDIVLASFPFTDLSGSKVRPVLVISNNSYKGDVITIFISSVRNKVQDYCVGIKSDNKNGLKNNSFIKCNKIATLDRKMVLGELGKLEESRHSEVLDNLKRVFEL